MVNIESRIVSLEEIEESVNIMVYGRSGVGKTVFAGSSDRVLFIAPEDDGTISARRQGSKADKWPVTSWSDVQDAYLWLTQNEEEAKDKYDWISIDSITRMQKLLLAGILEDIVEENPDRDPDIPAIQDYQKWQRMFERFVLAFNALPINICWTALVRAEEDEDGNAFLIPDIQGKGYQMAQSIASFMTSYGCMQNRKVRIKPKEGEEDKEPQYKIRRIITWEDTGVIQGKDRTDVLSPVTVDITLQQIYDRIYNKELKEI